MKVTNVEELKERIQEIRKAQKIFATYTQEQVDEIFRQATLAIPKDSSLATMPQVLSSLYLL
jgi:hypothetical protein